MITNPLLLCRYIVAKSHLSMTEEQDQGVIDFLTHLESYGYADLLEDGDIEYLLEQKDIEDVYLDFLSDVIGRLAPRIYPYHGSWWMPDAYMERARNVLWASAETVDWELNADQLERLLWIVYHDEEKTKLTKTELKHVLA